MKDISEDAIGSTDKWIVIIMFIILNLFLIWIFRFPLMKQAIGVKIISVFFSLIFFLIIALEFVLLHKIIIMFLGQKSSIKLDYKWLVGLIIAIFVVIFILINLQTYSYGVNALLCEKVENKPSENCDLIDFSAVYSEYSDLLSCENIYSASKGKLGIFSFLKNKASSCFFGKVFKI